MLSEVPTRTTPSQVDLEEDAQHDQLPSVEDVKITNYSRRTKTTSSPTRKPIMLMVAGVALVLLFCGAVAGIVYIVNLVGRAGGDGNYDIDPNTSTVDHENNTNDPADDVADMSVELVVGRVFSSIALLQGGTEFESANSYQSLALKTMELNARSYQHLTDARLAQVYGLLCLYHSTNRVRTSATDEVYGLGTVPRWAIDRWGTIGTNECTWTGVLCDGVNLVQSIDLTGRILTGALPQEMTLLSNLKTLNLNQNPGLGGGVPSFLADIPSLTRLTMTGCSYEGNMPTYVCDQMTQRATIYIETDCKVECSCCDCI